MAQVPRLQAQQVPAPQQQEVLQAQAHLQEGAARQVLALQPQGRGKQILRRLLQSEVARVVLQKRPLPFLPLGLPQEFLLVGPPRQLAVLLEPLRRQHLQPQLRPRPVSQLLLLRMRELRLPPLACPPLGFLQLQALQRLSRQWALPVSFRLQRCLLLHPRQLSLLLECCPPPFQLARRALQERAAPQQEVPRWELVLQRRAAPLLLMGRSVLRQVPPGLDYPPCQVSSHLLLPTRPLVDRPVRGQLLRCLDYL